MMCEKCNVRIATIHLTEIIKEMKSEVHLCETCAREIGLNSKLSNFSLSISDILTFLDSREIERLEDKGFCRRCGSSFSDFGNTGKLGCPECYSSFKESLKPVILGYHNEKKHIGKIPNNFGNYFIHLQNQNEAGFSREPVEEMKKKLDDAIFEERFEDAALLRDRIKLAEG